MKKELGIAVSLVSLFAVPAMAEGEKRELGAHEHGHSALNVAIEGDRVEMELIAPGADIVGFEYVAESLALFGFTDSAGCVVETAAVEIEGEEHDEHGDEVHAEEEHHEEEHAEDEHHDEDEEHAKHEEHGEHEEHEDEVSHNEFHAEYALSCSTPDALDGIDFAAFFEAFAGAEEVEVTVISESGQTSYEVERDAPVVDLQGVI